ncbi:hypothetical protein Tco_0217798 [Tanacetum coccineum]
MMDRKDLFETKAKGRSDGKAKEKILVLIPETTFVGVESRVLIPETTFVGVESWVLIPETTVWDTLVYPLDTLIKMIADLEELRELGSNTFGTVYHGKWRGIDVTIK